MGQPGLDFLCGETGRNNGVYRTGMEFTTKIRKLSKTIWIWTHLTMENRKEVILLQEDLFKKSKKKQ